MTRRTLAEVYGKREDEDWAQWGYRTGRYSADRIPFWQEQLDNERRQVRASGGDPTVSQVAGTIASMYPAFAPGMSALGPPADDDDDEYRGTAQRVLAAAGLDPYTGRPRRTTAAGARSETPLLDELDLAVKGPTREQRWRAQDVQAEAELREQLERERVTASGGLTDAEYRALFGDQ
ncbi:MAG TPA: hypothetical protein VGP91_11925 [Actinoplanes sp.]|jgi:hypothetical protein|nr:hypothetical protein [Actinoplanes sp.]